MKFFKIYSVLIIAVLSFILCSCPQNNTVKNPDPDPAPTISEMKQDLFDKINNHRSSISLTILTSDAELDSVAVKHSFKMAIQKNTDVSGLDASINEYKTIYPNAIVRSIVASSSQADVTTVFGMLRDFQITLLEGDYNNLGIGIYKNDSYYYTVLFSKK